MAITLSTTTKTNITLVPDTKKGGDTITWDESSGTWDEHWMSTWNVPRADIETDSKNNVTLSNDSKN